MDKSTYIKTLAKINELNELNNKLSLQYMGYVLRLEKNMYETESEKKLFQEKADEIMQQLDIIVKTTDELEFDQEFQDAHIKYGSTPN